MNNFTLYNTFNNVNSNYNQLVFNKGAGDVIVTLDQNLYNTTDLLNHIDTKITAAGLTNAAFVNNNNIITMTSDDSFKLVRF